MPMMLFVPKIALKLFELFLKNAVVFFSPGVSEMEFENI
jgi:hypothetical protein